MESDKFTIENYDLTDLNMGQLSYRDNLDIILKKNKLFCKYLG